MKPPRCSVCEHEHWLREPHVFKGAVKEAEEFIARKKVVTRGGYVTKEGAAVVTRNQACAECAAKDEEIVRLKRLLSESNVKLAQMAAGSVVDGRKPKRDRAAYMRARRAAGVPK